MKIYKEPPRIVLTESEVINIRNRPRSGELPLPDSHDALINRIINIRHSETRTRPLSLPPDRNARDARAYNVYLTEYQQRELLRTRHKYIPLCGESGRKYGFDLDVEPVSK